MRRLLPLVLAAPLAACVSFDWERDLVDRPVDPGAMKALAERQAAAGATLADCLELFGAPTIVREHRVHGLVIAYAWARDRTLGAQVSVPVNDNQSASFSYARGRLDTPGIVLWLDADWRLVEWREGRLSDLIGGPPPPPASLDDIEAG